jgi:creatinine amidohydrolase/Fe(II)-dependent formamide hydrolase-like protein
VIHAASYYTANGQLEMLKGEGESERTIGTHAGIRDTSELLALDATGVRMEHYQPDADGASGDAGRASAIRGKKLLDLKVQAAIAGIKAAR